jgi:hypothetical protein
LHAGLIERFAVGVVRAAPARLPVDALMVEPGEPVAGARAVSADAMGTASNPVAAASAATSTALCRDRFIRSSSARASLQCSCHAAGPSTIAV